MQAYSNPKRESDPHALPDLEVFQATAQEIAEGMEDEIRNAMKMPQFRLANMYGSVRAAMLDYIVKENGVEGGWCYWYCLPGCMPDSSLFGPFKSAKEALADARENAQDDYDDYDESDEADEDKA